MIDSSNNVGVQICEICSKTLKSMFSNVPEASDQTSAGTDDSAEAEPGNVIFLVYTLLLHLISNFFRIIG